MQKEGFDQRQPRTQARGEIQPGAKLYVQRTPNTALYNNIFPFNKQDLYGFFSHLNRFKFMFSLSFSLISDFCHSLQAI